MVKNNYFSSFNHIHHHHHLSLLTLCGKRVKQSQTVRSGRFESNLLTWPDRPNTHAWGSTSRFTHATFPFNSRCTEQAHRPRLQESPPRYDAGSWAYLHPHVAAWEQRSKTAGSMFRLRCNPVLKLIDYHISRHVVSTFKSLTTTTTHCGLIHFH